MNTNLVEFDEKLHFHGLFFKLEDITHPDLVFGLIKVLKLVENIKNINHIFGVTFKSIGESGNFSENFGHNLQQSLVLCVKYKSG